MPSRRGKGGKAKKKRAVTTRLIEISMKLDEYVYRKKPISAVDAQDYIEEISIYKPQCLKDERSLQVIEKLTRCMKAIVDEERIDDGREKHQYVGLKTTACCPSPTYSLVEDLELGTYNEQTKETQDIVQPNAVGATSEKVIIDTIDLQQDVGIENTAYCLSPTYSLDEDLKLVTNNEQTLGIQHIEQPVAVGTTSEKFIIDTIDLCAAEEIEREHTVFHIDVEMHRTRSNLSIRDQDYSNTTGVYSQSILDNLVQDSCIQPNLLSCINDEDRDRQVKERAQNAIHPEFTLAECSAISTYYKDGSVPDFENINEITLISANKRTQTNQKVTELTDVNFGKKKQESVKKAVRFETIIKKETNDNAVAKDNIRNLPKKDTKKMKNSLKSKLNRQNNFKTKKIPKKQANKQKKTKKQNNVTNDNISAKTSKTNAESNGPNTNSIVTNTVSNSNNVKKAEKYLIPKIYSYHTENDLSWVENIRFVREIHEEEVDIKLSSLNESFWEDLSVPSDWDDQEFNV